MADKFLTTRSIKAGATSVSIAFHATAVGAVAAGDGDGAVDLTGKDHEDFAAYYVRQGGEPVEIALIALAGPDAEYASGGLVEIDATNMPGHYRLDLPDAAVSAGADWVLVAVTFAGMKTVSLEFALPNYSSLARVIWDDAVEMEGAYSAQAALSIMLSILAGRTENGGTTFKTPNNVATRATISTSAAKNRTAVTLTPSDPPAETPLSEE